MVSRGPQMVEMPNVIGVPQNDAIERIQKAGLIPSCFMVVNDGSLVAGCVVSCGEDAGTMVEAGSVITVYIAADPSVEITTEPPADSDSGSGESAMVSSAVSPQRRMPEGALPSAVILGTVSVANVVVRIPTASRAGRMKRYFFMRENSLCYNDMMLRPSRLARCVYMFFLK